MRSSKKLFSLFCTAALLHLTLFISCSKDSIKESDTPIIPTDNIARLAAKKLYEDYYLPSKSNGQEAQWTGNEPNCNAGNVPQDIKDKIYMRLSYYRMAVGLHNTIAEDATKSDKAQQAALMMKANNRLEHNPPNTWKCFTQDGKDGAGSSLLTMSKNAEAMDSYIRDQGANNGPVGHRRWLLWPRLQEIGVGNTDSSNAIWVIGNAGTAPVDAPEFISWPPEGYIPDMFAFPRWSFSIKDADFTNTKVSMKDGSGSSISLDIEALDNQYGDRTIVWVPEGITPNVSEDTLYTVTLEDVDVGGEIRDYTYEVILFNPDN
ncbi:CAP domain-containing protein [Muriicola sp. Z0-33]|uniref:CAP domain-containing protein n=1 Tax=Muriicola sp. Z0-33 TaxID=2816957 RepID=UPI002237F820|nr:CAP domain-containing protein [Muriicola sp. Z0-33]MCW5516424.1 CAP domain-containing protein [Muriicola sp. Z0-33]